MRRKPVLICGLLVAPVLCLSVFGYGQPPHAFVKSEEDAFNQVAAERRARLADRLGLYIESLSKGEFGGIYDLMPDACRRGLGKDEWLKHLRHESPGRIRQFVVEEVYAGDHAAPESLGGEQWIAGGCATYLDGNKTARYKAAVHVVWLNGDWYICGSGIAVEGPDNEYLRCPAPRAGGAA